MTRLISRTTLALLVTATAAAQEGNLGFGAITRHGSTLQVPVMLNGDVGDGVSTMDFRFRYDPAVLQPISFDAGGAASAAGKQVLSNEVRPGEYSVLMWGEQQGVSPGQVALVRLRVLESPEGGQTSLTLAGISMARPDATAIPARSATQIIPITDRRSDEPDEEPSETPEEPEEEEPLPPVVPGGSPSSGSGISAEVVGLFAEDEASDSEEGLSTYGQLASRLREASRLRGALPTGGVQRDEAQSGEPGGLAGESATNEETATLFSRATTTEAEDSDAVPTELSSPARERTGGTVQASTGAAEPEVADAPTASPWRRWALIGGAGLATFAAVWLAGRRFTGV